MYFPHLLCGDFQYAICGEMFVCTADNDFFFDSDLHRDWQNTLDGEMKAWHLQYKD